MDRNDEKNDNQMFSTGPTDETLEAYKAWMQAMFVQALHVKTVELTEDEWITAWREYWEEHGTT